MYWQKMSERTSETIRQLRKKQMRKCQMRHFTYVYLFMFVFYACILILVLFSILGKQYKKKDEYIQEKRWIHIKNHDIEIASSKVAHICRNKIIDRSSSVLNIIVFLKNLLRLLTFRHRTCPVKVIWYWLWVCAELTLFILIYRTFYYTIKYYSKIAWKQC